MDFSLLAILITLPLFLLVCGACAAAETALFSLSFHDRLRLRKLSPGAAAAVDRLLTHPRSLLVLLLFFNMLSSTVYYVLTSIVALHAENHWLQLGIGAVNLLAMTLMAEVVSKLLAGKLRVEFCRYGARVLLLVYVALAPLRTILDRGVVAPLTRLVLPHSEPTALGPGELAALLELGAEQGAIDADEQRVLRQVIHFGLLRVRDVMTPRIDMEWLDESAGTGEIMSLVKRTHLTRVPVCRGSLDESVTGLLNTKKYLAAAARAENGAAIAMETFLEQVRYVPERASLDKLLEQFRTGSVKLALCVDEYGSLTGVVATQDIVRRLVAELSSQQNVSEAENRIEMVGLGCWSVPGRLSARDWAEMFGVPPDPRVSTVAGLVMAKFGRLPAVGESITLGTVKVEVAALSGRVVDRVLVTLTDAAPPLMAGVAR